MSGCGYIVIVEDSGTTLPVPATHLPVTSGKLVNWSTCRELEFPRLSQLAIQ
jgi:hypothetical protein